MKFSLFILAISAFGQSNLPSQVVFASASYTDHPGGKFAGTLSYATKLPAPANCYNYDSLDIGLVKIQGKQTFQQSTRVGGACAIPQLSSGDVTVFVLATGGVTVANANMLPSGAVGGLVAWRPKGKNWGAWGDVQSSNTTGKTARVGVLFGWGGK